MTDTDTDRRIPCGNLIASQGGEARCTEGHVPGDEQCPTCPDHTPGLNELERTRCEVWTRVMGYHRPVSAFNAGKRAEHQERRYFDEHADGPGAPLMAGAGARRDPYADGYFAYGEGWPMSAVPDDLSEAEQVEWEGGWMEAEEEDDGDD
jgi:hypothetical protein